jgi:hypothetical protein
MCDYHWTTAQIINHLSRLAIEKLLFPNDGSIDFEIEAAQQLLSMRGVPTPQIAQGA